MSGDKQSLLRYLETSSVLDSTMHVQVNAVNCVGIMGKGIALAFKKRYPAMYQDYVIKCKAGLVKIGEPYLYKVNESLSILNFPTKNNWREPYTRMDAIRQGLQYLSQHAPVWGIRSMAFPALGCGNGGLEWEKVHPVMKTYLDKLNIPIEIYAPLPVKVDSSLSEPVPHTLRAKRKISIDKYFFEPKLKKKTVIDIREISHQETPGI